MRLAVATIVANWSRALFGLKVDRLFALRSSFEVIQVSETHCGQYMFLPLYCHSELDTQRAPRWPGQRVVGASKVGYHCVELI